MLSSLNFSDYRLSQDVYAPGPVVDGTEQAPQTQATSIESPGDFVQSGSETQEATALEVLETTSGSASIPGNAPGTTVSYYSQETIDPLHGGASFEEMQEPRLGPLRFPEGFSFVSYLLSYRALDANSKEGLVYSLSGPPLSWRISYIEWVPYAGTGRRSSRCHTSRSLAVVSN